MLLSKSYDSKVDIWALGILLYEMLHGDAPYGEETPILEKMELIKKNKKIKYDDNLSVEVLDLIKKLLKRDPEKRSSMEELFDHEWMRSYEASYDIDINSFLSQNSIEASNKGCKSEMSFKSLKNSAGTESQRSIYSTMTSKPEKDQKKYHRLGPQTVKNSKSKKFRFDEDDKCIFILFFNSFFR